MWLTCLIPSVSQQVSIEQLPATYEAQTVPVIMLKHQEMKQNSYFFDRLAGNTDIKELQSQMDAIMENKMLCY